MKIGLLGFGTVGAGVFKLITERCGLLEERSGVRFEIKKILVRDLKKPRKVEVDPRLLTTNPEEVLADPEISTVVELIGGIEPARSYLIQAIQSGKKVVTANKLLLAEKGGEIFELARECKTPVGFEASVGGGIPIIRALQEGFVGNQINEIYGIVNATSNYILSEMSLKGSEFQEVFAHAQSEGYVESDPRMDIEGHDAAQKLSILTALSSGSSPAPDKIYVEGISRITHFDIESAEQLGFRIKLLAVYKQHEGRIEARVHPTFIPLRHPLSDVNGFFNAIYVKGDAVGETMFYGRGGGMMPTASAVVSDIVSVERTVFDPSLLPTARPVSFFSLEELSMEYYLRFTVVDRPGVLGQIANALGANEISIASVDQHGQDKGGRVPIVIMLHRAQEKNVRKAIQIIDQMEPVLDKTLCIRVEPLA